MAFNHEEMLTNSRSVDLIIMFERWNVLMAELNIVKKMQPM